MKPQESDWKVYRKLLPLWRERYLQAKNQELFPEGPDLSNFNSLLAVVRGCPQGFERRLARAIR